MMLPADEIKKTRIKLLRKVIYIFIFQIIFGSYFSILGT